MQTAAEILPPATAAFGTDRPREGFLVFDHDLRIAHVSQGLDALLDLPHPGKAGNSQHWLHELQTHVAGDLKQWRECCTSAPPHHSGTQVFYSTSKGRLVQGTVSRVDTQYLIAHLRDSSNDLSPEEQIWNESLLKDHLTGIGNRALLETRLDQAALDIAAGRTTSAAVFFLDLDRFKTVNDTLGHSVGDDLLRLVSDRLRNEIGDAGIVARMGGDEFAVLLTPCPCQASLEKLAKRLLDLIQRTYLIEGQVVHVGVSIGIAIAPTDGETRRQLLKRADLALYQSKSKGRGLCHFFEPAMEQHAQARRALEMDLRKALVLRQLEVHYQPHIDVATHAITGLEGLLRWRHPHRGLLLPGDFMALAQDIGMTIAIAEWVLKTICQEAKRWPSNVTLAMNVSPQYFENVNFIASIQKALKSAAINGDRLEIELTEDVLLRNSPKVSDTLQSLRNLGVKVTLDDFGTGVASLSQVVQLPFDRIKIDRSLINMQCSDLKNRAIVQAISSLGNALGIATLAKGVESAEHLAHVQSQGCHTVQGFYYSKAVPAGELQSLFDQFQSSPITRG